MIENHDIWLDQRNYIFKETVDVVCPMRGQVTFTWKAACLRSLKRVCYVTGCSPSVRCALLLLLCFLFLLRLLAVSAVHYPCFLRGRYGRVEPGHVMAQVARANIKSLKEGDSHVRLLVVIIPIFNVALSVCGILAVAITNLPTVEPRIGALYDKEVS